VSTTVSTVTETVTPTRERILPTLPLPRLNGGQ
jgi:hypothetical protein